MAIAGSAALLLSGCGSSGTNSPSGTTSTTQSIAGTSTTSTVSSTSAAPSAGSTSTSSTTAPSSASTSTSTSDTSTTSATSATPATGNLAVTDGIRSQLLQAGAALNSLPASDYTGLAPGQTYYAYDAATATYWAGAGLVPSSSSQQAQVSTQDDGGYLLFSQPAGGAWTARDVGLAGVGGTPCPVAVPAAILAAWNWAAGTCKAPGT